MAKKLGFGLMRLPQANPVDYTAVNMEELKEMVDYFLAHGFTYFDTSYVYHLPRQKILPVGL